MKNKIKSKAITLFNAHGIANVSMKQVADSLKMSAGNLGYHYKNKAALLAVIYADMYEETLDYILPENTYITLFHFEEMMLKFDDLQKRYCFFFNDLVHIIKTYPAIAKEYEASNLVRFKDARKLINYYIETERLVPENDFVDYNKTIYTIWMTSTFWQSQKLAIHTASYTTNKCGAIEMLWSILLPYLTAKGLEEYQQLRKFVKLPTN
ncbi:TetR/AcrR family transcriptional regulator [Cellulophaga omnivescoria]|uniref:TetR/AcrR family transcriptional regulator n=1 Tax=Cellulophaga omnivescoria TaxID=1888890 RepID=UPI000985A374|nr:TetR/AcrR family transcriptional regulator [Cellulophaga omnivescoria]WBU89057.1 TetR/AcrR family transcriptional regulator [Cellulophaga omnivescoria]WKB81031.1 TetR/AcrR family transcriptional regulator [Cellulophaga lytica]